MTYWILVAVFIISGLSTAGLLACFSLSSQISREEEAHEQEAKEEKRNQSD